MSQPSSQEQSPRSGIALESSRVSLGPARSLTSHARRIYKGKYLGRYRFAAWVFAIDAILVFTAVALSVAAILFVFSSPARFDGGLMIDLRAPEMRGSDVTPVTLLVKATDGRSHSGARLRVELPDWAEIVRSEPRQLADGSIELGTITPRSPQTAIILIRPRATDVDMPMLFHVRQNDWTGFVRDIYGRFSRNVGASALSVDSDPAVTSTASGATVPFIVHNSASVPIPSVIFRILGTDGGAVTIGGNDALALGSLEAGESRRVFVDMSHVASSSVSLFWQLQDGAQAVVSGTTTLPVASYSPIAVDDRFPGQTFPFDVEARYYSSAGDQIGVGSLPPIVGRATTYWIALLLGPTNGEMKDIKLHAELPKGVIATGKHSSSVDASFISNGESCDWRMSSLPTIGAERVSFACEVVLTPSKEQVGDFALLVSSTQADASTENGVRLSASAVSITTELVTDLKAAGRGIIQP